ncbi:GARP-like protein 1 [Giardia lamblia P15]|uniref:GARP-like protein 1 n=1 Tax=Giardia intestinalis (strain P15) TaxID=658858 RepID=E1F0J7_GIAIA|nr:GARP-like protein 1 [Giardia lamblia P15]
MSEPSAKKDNRIKRSTSLTSKSVAVRMAYCHLKAQKIKTNKLQNNSISSPKSEVALPELSITSHDSNINISSYCPLCTQFVRNGVTVEQVAQLLHSLRRIVATITHTEESMIAYSDMMNQDVLMELSNISKKIMSQTPLTLAPLAPAKVKFSWTEAFRKKADAAIYQLGVTRATPTRILNLIQDEFPNLTRQNVESYLQKIRIKIRKEESLSHMSRTTAGLSVAESSPRDNEFDYLE